MNDRYCSRCFKGTCSQHTPPIDPYKLIVRALADVEEEQLMFSEVEGDYCIFCNALQPWAEPRPPVPHTTSCIWVRARILVTSREE